MRGRVEHRSNDPVFHSGHNVPILFIKGSASLTKQANCGAGVVEGPSGADSMANAMKLAAAFARLHQPAADKEGRTCGKLVLQNSRGFWNGADLDLTVGAYRIIKLLASRPGHQHFTYRAIYDRLRHEGFVSGRGPNGYRVNVRSAFKRIRNKFRALDPKFQEIECYRAFGYRWRKPDRPGSEGTTRSALLRRQPVASAVELVVVGADDHGALVTRWSRPSGFEGCF